MVMAPASRAMGPEFKSRPSHNCDFKTGILVATLPDDWSYVIIARTGWPGVGILWLGEIASSIDNLYISISAHAIIWTELPLKYTLPFAEILHKLENLLHVAGILNNRENLLQVVGILNNWDKLLQVQPYKTTEKAYLRSQEY